VVDQIGSAIGEVALKNSQFHKQNDYNNLHSARYASHPPVCVSLELNRYQKTCTEAIRDAQ
jgi:hypothetical protein